MLEIKLTVSLDEKTAETLERLIGAMNREVTDRAADAEEAQPEKKAKAPIKATAAPTEEAAEEVSEPITKATVTPKNEPQQVVAGETEKNTAPAENITIEELRTLLAAAKREKGTDAIKAILKGYGVSLLSDLDPSHYAEVAQKVREL